MIRKRSRIFVNDFIPKVSRTFALAIKFLPANLRHPVFTAYLLCRLADTIEDSPFIPADEKGKRLRYLKDLLSLSSIGSSVSAEQLAPIYQAIDPEYGDDHRLLGKSVELFEVLGELPENQRRIIFRWAGEMAGGMAEFVDMMTNGSKTVHGLEDRAQWDRYCYYVAGTVGHMLTELFIAEYNFDNRIAGDLNRFCDSFGLGLQKVNTIKDVPGDTKRGLIFLPKDIMRKYRLTPELLGESGRETEKSNLVRELVNIAAAHLDDAIDYTLSIPERLKGVRLFLVVPIFLAEETLNLINRYPVRALVGPPVKISHADVARLTVMARTHSGSNIGLKEYHGRLKSKRANPS